MTQKERMLSGMIYNPNDEEIMEEQFPYLDMLGEMCIRDRCSAGGR